MEKLHRHQCVHCNYKIDSRIYEYSTKEIGYGLCLNCQDWFKKQDPKITTSAKLFALELQSRNVNLTIEKYDGFKHIDIAITSFSLNIEIDGSQHYTNVEQSLADIKRTCKSLEKGFMTIRIPNILIEKKEHRELAADSIISLLNVKKLKVEQINRQIKIRELLKQFYENNLLND